MGFTSQGKPSPIKEEGVLLTFYDFVKFEFAEEGGRK